MGYFPFFVELKGKRGLIVGGGIVAERKVRKLLPYEPELLVVAPKIDDGIWKLSEEIKEKRKKNEDTSELILSERDFETTNLEKMDFVIAATSDETLNARIAKLCEERNILVNVVDDKEKCGFLVPVTDSGRKTQYRHFYRRSKSKSSNHVPCPVKRRHPGADGRNLGLS